MIGYIAFEGIDGSGKDTQLLRLADAFNREGTTPIVLHEPSYGHHGRAVRAALADLPTDVARQRELFTSDRRDHAQRKITPALSFVRTTPGFVLLQNRSAISAAAYQPLGDADEDLRWTVDEQSALTPMPDIIILLDVDVATAIRRIASRGTLHSLERADVLESVRERYLRIAALRRDVVVIDARGDPDDVAQAIRRAVGTFGDGRGLA
ncbi:MAG TPA: dTMP kinase [Allosphingosinicella sp.]